MRQATSVHCRIDHLRLRINGMCLELAFMVWLEKSLYLNFVTFFPFFSFLRGRYGVLLVTTFIVISPES